MLIHEHDCLFSGEELMLKLCDRIIIASRWRSQSADGEDPKENFGNYLNL